MGEIIRVVCDACNYEKQLKTGGGLMSINPRVVEETLKDEDLLQWKNLKEEGKIRFFAWVYEPGFCEECKEIVSCFKVDIQLTDGESLSLGGRCNKCSCKVKLNKSVTDMECPVCGKASVAKNIVGHWD